ncbi:hypothetical protein R84B8_00551 [Treponema sp. R8-4-B8]
MKKLIKSIRNLNRARSAKISLLIIVITAIIGFSVMGCGFTSNNDNDSDNNNNNNNNDNGSGKDSNKNPGSKRENAISVTVGHSKTYTIRYNSEHWFKFLGTGDPVIFETTGDVVDTYMEIFEGDSTYNWSYMGNEDDNSGGGYNALLSKTPALDTMYYIKITPRSDTNGNYTFVISAPTSNIRTNPIQVTVGYSVPQIINSSGQHWFIFTGTGNRVFFETEGNVVNTNLSIFIESSGESSYSKTQGNKGVNFITVLGTTY